MAKAKGGATKRRDLLDVAFEVIAERGAVSDLEQGVAERAKVPLAEVYRAFRTRDELVGALTRRVDEAMLEADPAEIDELPPRDRVFELIMRRLEALLPYREGLKRLAAGARRDPLFLLLSAYRLERSLAWLQAAAGLEASGLRAQLARRALGLVYLRTLQVWFEDEGLDMAKTMAELDRMLRRAAPLAGLRERRTTAAGMAERPAGASPAAEGQPA